ncbi:MAG: M1 family metallopeptidase [Deltaproteobacteria bacterium]|nr:M1 family metallopeptidase [Deltaproteobacteria bacterium]
MADTQTHGASAVDEQAYKLPTNVRPDRYQIRLTPDLTAFTFAGEEIVTIEVLEPTAEICLNAAELQIHAVSIVSKSGKKVVGTATLDEINQRALLKLPDQLARGSYELQLTFSGILNDKLHGFYRSTYKDTQGNDKVLASTQFEATDARRAFPCWDEPAWKAVFQTTFIIPEHLTAISNTAVVRESPLPGTGKKEVVFADSIKMSTYLVAFIVGEFEGTEPVHVGKTPVRVWAVPGKRHLAPFGQEIGAASLRFFSDYYQYPYPGDKLDLIAIPDFAFGAMENLGAVTYRETALLVDPHNAARRDLERVANIVSHENAHMWFGDLVTMRWWNGLWLNEAFATFMAALAVDHIKPEWQQWTSFAVSRASAMQVDGLQSTRPIEFPVHRPEEAQGMFDVLTYQKGAAVLRMLEQYLGAEAFRAGISLYLKKHEYANTETTDLWDAIEEASRQPARALMDSWIFQPGYPMLKVEVQGNDVVISQQRFRYSSDGNSQPQLWHVPIFLRAKTAQGIHEQKALLTSTDIRLTLSSQPEWVVVNSGGHGFYRVQYSRDLQKCLTNNLDKILTAVERFNLINDTWAAAQAGLTPMTTYLDLLSLFREETDPNVWNVILASAQYLDYLLDAPQRPALQKFLRHLLTPIVQKLGWNPQAGESDLIGQLRGDLLTALGTLGADTTIQAEARTRYAQYKQNPTSIDRNVVPALVSIVAACGDLAEYEEFTSQYKQAKTPQDETRYLFALATFRSPELFERTLQLTINGEVRTQNAPYLMRALLLNTELRERAWQYMKDHWDEMGRQYPDNSIGRMCEGILSLVTPQREAEVINFFASHPVKQAEKTVQQHLEKLRIAVAGKERDAAKIARYLTQQV